MDAELDAIAAEIALKQLNGKHKKPKAGKGGMMFDSANY